MTYLINTPMAILWRALEIGYQIWHKFHVPCATWMFQTYIDSYLHIDWPCSETQHLIYCKWWYHNSINYVKHVPKAGPFVAKNIPLEGPICPQILPLMGPFFAEKHTHNRTIEEINNLLGNKKYMKWIMWKNIYHTLNRTIFVEKRTLYETILTFITFYPKKTTWQS